MDACLPQSRHAVRPLILIRGERKSMFNRYKAHCRRLVATNDDISLGGGSECYPAQMPLARKTFIEKVSIVLHLALGEKVKANLR